MENNFYLEYGDKLESLETNVIKLITLNNCISRYLNVDSEAKVVREAKALLQLEDVNVLNDVSLEVLEDVKKQLKELMADVTPTKKTATKNPSLTKLKKQVELNEKEKKAKRKK